ncbi:hypothetical protein DFJ73DRAFT_759875 [Zopfochytrium polystomum]|nr:hypothetical protein DFJ73DRAFT_759875 [Zopfochytrium polystomum]
MAAAGEDDIGIQGGGHDEGSNKQGQERRCEDGSGDADEDDEEGGDEGEAADCGDGGDCDGSDDGVEGDSGSQVGNRGVFGEAGVLRVDDVADKLEGQGWVDEVGEHKTPTVDHTQRVLRAHTHTHTQTQTHTHTNTNTHTHHPHERTSNKMAAIS